MKICVTEEKVFSLLIVTAMSIEGRWMGISNFLSKIGIPNTKLSTDEWFSKILRRLLPENYWCPVCFQLHFSVDVQILGKNYMYTTSKGYFFYCWDILYALETETFSLQIPSSNIVKPNNSP